MDLYCPVALLADGNQIFLDLEKGFLFYRCKLEKFDQRVKVHIGSDRFGLVRTGRGISIPTKPRFRSVPDVTVLNSQLFTELLIKCRRLPRGFFWNRNPPPCASLSHGQVYKAVCQTTICFKKQNFLFYWFYRRKSFYNFSQVFIESGKNSWFQGFCRFCYITLISL